MPPRQKPRGTVYWHLSIHFRQEEEQLLLEVWRQGVEGPRIYQSTKVGVDKNGPRCLKIYLFPSVALHLTCSFGSKGTNFQLKEKKNPENIQACFPWDQSLRKTFFPRKPDRTGSKLPTKAGEQAPQSQTREANLVSVLQKHLPRRLSEWGMFSRQTCTKGY